MDCKVYSIEDRIVEILKEYKNPIAHDCFQFVAQKIVEELNLHMVAEEESVYDDGVFVFDMTDQSYEKPNCCLLYTSPSPRD